MSVVTHHVNGYYIECYEAGQEHPKTIVFAHGLGSNYRQWIKQLSYFENNYHVIAFSLQGHGCSSVNETHEYSVDDYVQTAIQILDAQGVKDSIWVGNSMGGVIGYGVIQRREDLINQLITNGTTPEIKMSSGLLKTVKIMDQVLIKLMGFPGYIRFAAKNSTKYKTIVDDLYNLFEKTTPKTIIASHQILGDYSFKEVIKKRIVPITILKSPGDKDINRYLNKLKDVLTIENNVRIVEFPETGHICNMEKPEAFNELVKGVITNN